MNLVFESQIAGLKFHDLPKIINSPPDRGVSLRLEAEPTNPFDDKAIKVIYNDGNRDYMLGYIPRVMTDKVHPLLDVKEKEVILSYIDTSNPKKLFAMVAIYADMPHTEVDGPNNEPDAIPEIDI